MKKPSVPGHIAVIMDGNGRWAKKRGMRRTRGHEKGADSVREVTTECASLGVRELTLYALSSENFTRRPKTEINYLMKLLAKFLKAERDTLMENDVVFRTIGRTRELPRNVRNEIRELEEATADNGGMVMRLALNYGGRREILDAVDRFAAECVESGKKLKLTEKSIRKYFYDPEMSDPDLLIRTGGDFRISNFLLWQASYAEIVILDVYWPDFGAEGIRGAIGVFNGRERRYGGL